MENKIENINILNNKQLVTKWRAVKEAINKTCFFLNLEINRKKKYF